MIKSIAKSIWNMSEYYNVSLGYFAPWIFGLMVGVKPKQYKKDKR